MASTLTKLEHDVLLRRAQNLAKQNRALQKKLQAMTTSRDAYKGIVKNLCDIHGVRSQFDLFKLGGGK